jgi:hypothetical protein
MNYNLLKKNGSDGTGTSIVRVAYGGTFYPTTWKWEDGNYVMDSQASASNYSAYVSAYGYYGYPQLP